MVDGHAWTAIPDTGPIAEALTQRREWLDHLASGSERTRRQALNDLADDGRTEDRVRQGYTGRAVIELIQNAHDAIADGGSEGAVHLAIGTESLLVGNEGSPFDAERIESLTRLGSSAKSRHRTTGRQIGYKGIGFTSVFEITDRPQIMSRDVGFMFDRAAAEELVRQRLGDALDGAVPARYFPLPIDDLGGDAATVEDMLREGAATVIRLPFRSDRARDDALRMIEETVTSQTLLFLPAVRRIAVGGPDGSRGYTKREGGIAGAGRIVRIESDAGGRSSWLMRRATLVPDPAVMAELDDPLWHHATALDVAVALPWSDRGPRADARPQRVHSYFPTDDRLGRGLLIHGDFYLDESRRHAETKGPGGAVTRLVWERACELAAELVASVATWGRRVLLAVVPQGETQGLAGLIGERLEEELARAAIARPVTGGEPVIPRQLRRLASGEAGGDLVPLLSGPETLLHPDDDDAPTGELLERLGCARLTPATIASRLEPATSTLGYQAAASRIARWLRTLTDRDRSAAIEKLRGRPVLQDSLGRWTSARLLERRVPGTPPLPQPLQHAELREIRSKDGRWLVDQLGVPSLDLATALERLLASVESGAFPRTDPEHRECLELAWSIWESDARVLDREVRRLGAVPVPARTATARRQRSWRRADETYFGRDWGDPLLEELYGRLGEQEFLGEPPPASRTLAGRRRRFLERLGVSGQPRMRPFDQYRSDHYLEALRWQSGPAKDAFNCPDVHPNSPRTVDSLVLDRLDDILGLVEEPGVGAALARALAVQPDPFGPKARVSCTHSAHGRTNRARSVEGYQRWRLTTIPWVPVTGDPSGVTVQVPERSWREIPRTAPWLMVPRARIRPADAARLDLVSAERPGPVPVEQALLAIAKAHPGLEEAPPEAQRSAEWLLRRLDRELRGGTHVALAAPPLPAMGAQGPVWASDPAIPACPRYPVSGCSPAAGGGADSTVHMHCDGPPTSSRPW